MASSSTGALLLMLLFVLACGGNGGGAAAAAAVFSGCSFESQEEAEAFEAALLQQACFNVTAFGGGGGGGEGGCMSRLDTARGGAGSGPVPVLRAAVRDTLGEAVGAVAAVAGLASLSNHAREEMAVRDCIELVGYSVDELRWALDAMADPDGGVAAAAEEETESETRRRGARAEDDIHAWLSAAMGNQGTCLDGFHGTDGRLLRRVESAVAQLTQLVSNLLAMHKKLRDITPQHQHHHHHGNNNNKNGTAADAATGGGDDTGPSSDLPPWVTDVVDDVEEEVTATRGRGRSSSSSSSGTGRKAMRVDVVVAQDGSGRWRTVSEAVARAPSHSRRRYVIYVKRGVYEENVEVRKKKTNIVIVGEGMGETVITGSRSMAAGWTTFRSATFGNNKKL
uniref:Pectinesterase inhibitor domain-containing protein n=1 Tax=Oryza meridionalis TaxID=40149 RepID=A0A0E0C041_9ORYZ